MSTPGIHLFCHSNPGPDIDWWASLAIDEKELATEIWFNTGILDDPKLVRKLPLASHWRDVAHAIMEAEEVALVGDFRNAATLDATGGEPWITDIYLLAWMSDEDENCPTLRDIARFLLSCDDAVIKTMHREEEGFLSDKCVDRIQSFFVAKDNYLDFLEDFPRIRDLQLTTSEAILSQYEDAVQEWERAAKKEDEAGNPERTKRLAPYAQDIERIRKSHLDLLGKPSGVVAGYARNVQHEAFRKGLERYVLENNRVPEGEVERDGVGEFRVRDDS